MKYSSAVWDISVSVLLSLGIAGTARADSLILNPAGDASISEKNLNTPMGYESTLEAGTTGPSAGYKSSRALLRFNPTNSVPTNAIVTSAALILTLTQDPPTQTNLWFDLRMLLRAWSESVVTWTNRLSPAAPWSVPGGAAPADYASTVTQSNLIRGVGSYTFASNSNMVADVQSWVSNPDSNFGWILICQQQGLSQRERKFGSREDAANAPSLVVQYTVPTLAPTLTLLPPLANQFRFSFNAESNRTYTVEYADALPSTNWSVLTNIPAQPVPTNFVVSTPFTSSNRFYRVWTP